MVIIAKQFIYIKTRKTGSTTVEMILQRALLQKPVSEINEGTIISPTGDIVGFRHCRAPPFMDCFDDHMPLCRVQSIIPNAKDRKLIICVRNPWDMVVSFYNFHLQKGLPCDHITKSFDDFVNTDLYDFNHCIMDGYAEFKTYFVRLEYLREDLEAVQVALGLDLQLQDIPHANSSEHEPYRSFYTSETRDRVAQIFHDVIEKFNYTF